MVQRARTRLEERLLMTKLLENIDNFIFDMDGTILNSSEEVLKCLKKAYEETGLSYDASKISTDIIGPPLKGIFQLISPELNDDEILAKLESAYRRHYDYNENDSSILYDGISCLMDTLNKMGKNLFIATNKPAIPTLRLMNAFGLNFFKDIYTLDKFENIQINKEEMVHQIISKYGLDKTKTVMIGDAYHDVIAGKNNGILSVGVLWGYAKDKKDLIEASDIVVGSVSELIELI